MVLRGGRCDLRRYIIETKADFVSFKAFTCSNMIDVRHKHENMSHQNNTQSQRQKYEIIRSNMQIRERCHIKMIFSAYQAGLKKMGCQLAKLQEGPWGRPAALTGSLTGRERSHLTTSYQLSDPGNGRLATPRQNYSFYQSSLVDLRRAQMDVTASAPHR